MRINNKEYKLIKHRTYDPVDVYKGKNDFLRIGPNKVLAPEIAYHRQLIKLGFPVPLIYQIGRIGSKIYFTEQSLGPKHFGEIFAQDMKRQGKIREENFSAFLKVCLKLASSQIRSKSAKKLAEFKKGIHLGLIQKELLVQKTLIKKVFNKIFRKLAPLPYTYTHGDFGPFNIYPKGAIDFGSFFVGPIGYDLVSALNMTDFFPTNRDFEFYQQFRFTDEQKIRYYRAMDELFLSEGLPRLSDFKKEFILCRSLWVAARMQKFPKIQAWRYRQLKQLLKDYEKYE